MTQYNTNINDSDYNDKQQGTIENLQWPLQECITNSKAEQWQHLHLSLELNWHQLSAAVVFALTTAIDQW